MMKIIHWIKINKLECLAIFTILFVAAFLRFYRLSEYMTFLGDEGRDALMIKRILTTFDIPLIGPSTSIGNMYLGPLYYYMITVPMAIFWLNPVAAAGMVALIGTLSVGLIYYLSRAWFGFWAAVISSILYAISPVNIIYSRSSWNPNPAPFFALLATLGMFKAHSSGDFRWFILTGASLAFVVQMHYLALILIPIFGLLWLYEISLILRQKLKRRYFLSGTIISILVFLFLMSPLAIFDFRHNFINYKAVTTFFLNRETTVNVNPFNSLVRAIPIYNNDLVGRYMTGENPWLTPTLSVLVILPLLIAIWRRLKKKQAFRWPYLDLGIWLMLGILGLSLYKQTIYDHYLGFLNPAPFILFGSLAYIIQEIKWRFSKYLLGLLVLLSLVIIIVNIQINPLKNPPNNFIKRTQDVSKFIIAQTGEKPFNFALIAEHNYDSAYQFYLEIYNHKPKQVPFEITDQLFVVCEDAVCQPTTNAKYEIVAFGWTAIAKEQNFQGVKVYKLIHNPDQIKKNSK